MNKTGKWTLGNRRFPVEILLPYVHSSCTYNEQLPLLSRTSLLQYSQRLSWTCRAQGSEDERLQSFLSAFTGFFFVLYFYSEDGSNMLVRNVCRLPTRYTIRLSFPLWLQRSPCCMTVFCFLVSVSAHRWRCVKLTRTDPSVNKMLSIFVLCSAFKGNISFSEQGKESVNIYSKNAVL
jgi:hypothetical protein